MTVATKSAPKKVAAVSAAAPTPTFKKTSKVEKRVNVEEMREKDVFSEISHYVLLEKGTNDSKFKHLESGKTVSLSHVYVEELLSSSQQYNKTVEVGKEDKYWTEKQISELNETQLASLGTPRVGDLRQKGIRTIWDEIHSAQVFCVSYFPKDKEVKKADLAAAREAQYQEALNTVITAKNNKKSMEEAVKVAITKIQNNPIKEVVPADLRVLHGYKLDFSSVTGLYNVIDMEIPEGQHNVRQVNVNTIQSLVFNGVQYIVK